MFVTVLTSFKHLWLLFDIVGDIIETLIILKFGTNMNELAVWNDNHNDNVLFVEQQPGLLALVVKGSRL